MTFNQETANRAADTMLVAAQLAIDMASIDRVPRYRPGHRENDAEHCFSASLVLPEIAHQHFPELTPELVCVFAVTHELAEKVTGDVATFGLSNDAIRTKEAADATAATELIPTLPAWIRGYYVRYKSQLEPEARFVRLGEKALVMAVDILGPGKQVMAEDYGVMTRGQLLEKQSVTRQRLRATFPEADFVLLHRIWDVLAERFAAEFEAAAID